MNSTKLIYKTWRSHWKRMEELFKRKVRMGWTQMKMHCWRKEQEMRFLESQKRWNSKVTELGSLRLFFIRLIRRLLLLVRTPPSNCGITKLVNASRPWENIQVWSIILISIPQVRCLPVVHAIWPSSSGESIRTKNSNVLKLSRVTNMKFPVSSFWDPTAITSSVAQEIKRLESGMPIPAFCWTPCSNIMSGSEESVNILLVIWLPLLPKMRQLSYGTWRKLYLL